MDRILCRFPCLSESKKFNNKEIYENLFNKKVDRRNIEGAALRFIDLNRKMFDFLKIECVHSGVNHDFALSFRSSNYIGAIPVRMPYDGIVHKDIQVTTRFDSFEDVFSDISKLLARLEYSISPEFSDNERLCNPMQLKPPQYYEAMKYVDLFDAACRYSWMKFDVQDRSHSYPKSNTNWRRYSLNSADPQKALSFPSRDSILTTDHTEWRQLKYVFDVAKNLLADVDTPPSIRYFYQSKIRSLTKKVGDIIPKSAEFVHLRTLDPRCITEVKKQANVILSRESTKCAAWRIDMACVFERYVQTVVARAVSELSGAMYANSKIRGKGHIPSWGLMYLEPDITICLGDKIYMADAKYKANYYAPNVQSKKLKETHRADLHQVLAYCSFEPQQTGRAAILFYPANTPDYRVIDFSDEGIGGTSNRVILCGLPFGIKEIDKAPAQIKQLLQELKTVVD